MDKPRRQAGRTVGRSDRGEGFTLVELLLVMFIMAVLVALVVGIGASIVEEGNRRKTEAKQVLLMNAIEAYHRVTGKYPPDRDGTLYDPNNSTAVLLRYLDGHDCGGLAEDVKEKAKVFLREIADDPNMDAWGRAMRYYNRGGRLPVIISSGPDENFGDEIRARIEDNIRSDRSR